MEREWQTEYGGSLAIKIYEEITDAPQLKLDVKINRDKVAV